MSASRSLETIPEHRIPPTHTHMKRGVSTPPVPMFKQFVNHVFAPNNNRTSSCLISSPFLSFLRAHLIISGAELRETSVVGGREGERQSARAVGGGRHRQLDRQFARLLPNTPSLPPSPRSSPPPRCALKSTSRAAAAAPPAHVSAVPQLSGLPRRKGSE